MAALNEIGLRPIPSEANFILIEFPEERCAREASEFLMRMAVIPRWLGPAGPPNCLRITIGSRFENDTFLMAITRYMNSGSLK